MAFNPSPQVAVARDAAEKLGAEQVIIVYLNHTTGELSMASYGKSKELCRQAAVLGDAAYEAVHQVLSD